MIKQFANIKKRYNTIEKALGQEDIIKDLKAYATLSKEYKDLSKIVEKIDLHQKITLEIKDNQSLLETEKDPELITMIKEEQITLEKKSIQTNQELKLLLLPKDPNDDKNVILELRAGTGGDEAALWAKDLFRMYQRYIDNQRWQIEILSFTEGSSGGYKEIICNIIGKEVYRFLKYESGVHRVQRIPATETQGRLHTSAASVVILPEVDNVTIEIDMNEVKKETFCSSGPGGQSVNTTRSAVRLTHLPTGIVASCQDGKSQIKNLEQALKVLRARLYERAQKEQQAKIGAQRKTIVGSGDRSVKIRTYNYPRAWVIDHRINYTEQNLPAVLNGELNKLIEALRLADHTAKLADPEAFAKAE